MGFTELELFAIQQSLIVAFFSVLIILPPAIFFAYILTRYDFRGKVIVETILLFPLVLPPVVTGYILLLLVKKNSLIGGFFYNVFHIEIAFTPLAAILASSIIIFPLILRPVKISMESIDPNFIKVSRGLGKSSFQTFFHIILPLCIPGIVAGAVLGFARSLGEFGATIMVAGNIPFSTTTIPLAVYSFFNQIDGGDALSRLVIVCLLLSFLSLLLSEYFLRMQKKCLK
ncbi:MAG: molybdate ABC transporter permease subunit [Spirochaetaceae bacterium]|nr:molybdate ABC transporter permease subunit [Spirochaetaceae bacterium]